MNFNFIFGVGGGVSFIWILKIGFREEWFFRKKVKNEGVVIRRRRNVGLVDKNNRCLL